MWEYDTLVVAYQGGASIRESMKFSEQVSNPDYLSSSIGHNLILGFTIGAGDGRLLFNTPGNKIPA